MEKRTSDRRSGASHVMWLLAGTALAGAMMLGGGCARRAHLRSNFGVITHQYFEREARAASGRNAQGLDPEEAALIHADYRKLLGQPSGSQSSNNGAKVLIVHDGGKGYGSARQP